MSMHNQRDRRRRRHFSGYLPRVGKKQRWTAGLTAVLVGGVIFGNCRASEITAPNFKSKATTQTQRPKHRPEISRSMIGHERNTFPMGPHETNPCDGSPIIMDGSTTVSLHTSVSTTGQTHMYVVTRTTAKAQRNREIVTDDDIWTANSEDFSEVQLSPLQGSAQEMTVRSRDIFVSRGKSPNWARHNQYHITMNSNGEITATPQKNEVRCEG